MGRHFEGDLQWCCTGRIGIEKWGPILGDHRIYFGFAGLQQPLMLIAHAADFFEAWHSQTKIHSRMRMLSAGLLLRSLIQVTIIPKPYYLLHIHIMVT